MTSPTWHERVSNYIEHVAEINETIDLILDETRVGTINVRSEDVDAQKEQLAQAVQRLEEMVPRREELLKAGDAPAQGITLREKLLATRRIDDARLARRCEEISGRMDDTRNRAVSLFVCQYHLANLGQDLIDLLAGASGPSTYGQKLGRDKPKPSGGGLFNEAA